MNFQKIFLSLTNKIIFLLLLILNLFSCDVLSPDKNEQKKNSEIKTIFLLTDTTKQIKKTFRSGEEFYMIFQLINNSNDTIIYTLGSTRPPIIFTITQANSIVSTSIDGYIFIDIMKSGKILPNDTLITEWKAPNTPAKNPQIVLEPGLYRANVLLPKLNVKIDSIPPLIFEVF